MDNIEVTVGDITQFNVDAIVNAANTSLLGGGGVDGAIHKAAGIELLNECRMLKGCGVGEAKITKGYNLKARYVIHTVGPVYLNGQSNEEELLSNCYRNSINLALGLKLKCIAFPCISTGVYRFPKPMAAAIAVNTVKKFLDESTSQLRVVFVCFSLMDKKYYEPFGLRSWMINNE